MTSRNGRCLLDTNIVIALFSGEPQVLKILAQTTEVFIPSVVIGELYYGAYRSRNRDKNLERVNLFVKENSVLACDTGVALEYGAIKNQLKQQGTPIPENDIWIAAIAMKHNLTLITRDKHMENINGLDIQNWQ